MIRKISIIAAVLAAVIAPVHADEYGSTKDAGFQTGSCAFPAREPMPGSGKVITVDQHARGAFRSIQAGVKAAREGDVVMVHPGVYREAVVVTTPNLRIHGTDRNRVVLDGAKRFNIGMKILADRVLVENMTAHHYHQHGFYWFNVTGYWGRYLTAYDNELYGLYAFDARCGQFDHSYASGNADSGFYIGECYPCDAVITNVLAEQNALGYSGTNAGGNLILRDSVWRNNAMGIVPNSLDSEKRPPQRGITIKNNLVTGNNNKKTPGTGIAGAYWGAGIVIAGGRSNSVYGNRVIGHALGGIAISPLPDQNVWIPWGNTIWGNTVGGLAGSNDLAQAAASGPDNCWSDNVFKTSAPAGLQSAWSCSMVQTPPGGDPRVEALLVQGAIGQNGRTPTPAFKWPAPGFQKNQPAVSDWTVRSWLPALGWS